MVPAVVHLCVVVLTCAWGCSSRENSSYKPSYRGARVIDLEDIGFDDGDTFSLRGRRIRVLGIDTPEIAHPEMGILENQPYGIAASESTMAWITRAERIEYVPGGRDRYNRRLAHVFLDGELLAIRLIRAGLAYQTVSHYGDSGFPDLAQQILDASRNAPKPQFTPPHRWKRKQRQKSGG